MPSALLYLGGVKTGKGLEASNPGVGGLRRLKNREKVSLVKYLESRMISFAQNDIPT